MHAYLLVGPRGSGVEEAARDVRGAARSASATTSAAAASSSAACIPTSSSSSRAARRISSKDDVRNASCRKRRGRRSKASARCSILFEAERLRGNQNESANAMLKTLEEPPARTVVSPRDVGRRRLACRRSGRGASASTSIPLADDTVRAALERDGVPAANAATLRVSPADSSRAPRALVGPLRELRAAFAAAPPRVDGYGATALAIAAGARRRGRRPRRPRSPSASTTSSTDVRRGDGTPRLRPKDAQRLRRRIEERHKRETRRARIDMLIEGVTAIESVYRDALGRAVRPAERRPPTCPSRRVPRPRRSTRAGSACEAFLINEKGIVRLTYLLMCLPPASQTSNLR